MLFRRLFHNLLSLYIKNNPVSLVMSCSSLPHNKKRLVPIPTLPYSYFSLGNIQFSPHELAMTGTWTWRTMRTFQPAYKDYDCELLYIKAPTCQNYYWIHLKTSHFPLVTFLNHKTNIQLKIYECHFLEVASLEFRHTEVFAQVNCKISSYG